MLQRTLRWYVDGTLKVVKDPFYKLFTVHAFIKSSDKLKQVPLIYCLMSGKEKADYKGVFSTSQSLMNPIGLVTYFESAIWGGFTETFHGIKIFGCVFHSTQAVYRRMTQMG